jgi:hypothetical protein
MKHSMANTLLLGPTPRQKPVGTVGRFGAHVFDLHDGDVVGLVDALSTASMSMPFWKAGGSQRAMTESPRPCTSRPPTFRPARVAEMVSR